jgi:hypothetical protein
VDIKRIIIKNGGPRRRRGTKESLTPHPTPKINLGSPLSQVSNLLKERRMRHAKFIEGHVTQNKTSRDSIRDQVNKTIAQLFSSGEGFLLYM